MRQTYNAVWSVSAADAALVAAALGLDGSPKSDARAAAALVAARPGAALDVDRAAVDLGLAPEEVVRLAAERASVEAAKIVDAGKAAAAEVGIKLSSVASGAAPGLFVQLLAWDPPLLERAQAHGVPVEVLPSADLAHLRARGLAVLPEVTELRLTSGGFEWEGVHLSLGPEDRPWWIAAASLTAVLDYPQPPVIGIDGVVVFDNAEEMGRAAAAAITMVQRVRAAAAWTAGVIAQAASPDEIDEALNLLLLVPTT